LPFVLAAVSFSAVIASFESTKTITAGRYLAQKALVIKDVACQIIGLVVMLLWAITDRSIWAMVVGGLVSSVVGVAISHVLLPGIPNRFEWSRSAIHEILHFGKWVFLSSVVGFLVNNGDRMMLGGLIGARELGIYVTAFFIVSSINAVAGKLMGNVAFPVLSDAVRTRPAELKRLYYRFRRPFDWGLFFLVGLLFETGRNIIFVLYDPRYASAGAMLEILSISLLASRYNLADQCYMALGHPRVMTLLIAIRAVALFTLLPLAHAKYGMNGALWAIVISTFSSIPATIYYKFKFDLLELKKELVPIPMLFLGIGVGYVIQQIVFLCIHK
jgi:O-antigen/teichoic acid export membrane protein